MFALSSFVAFIMFVNGGFRYLIKIYICFLCPQVDIIYEGEVLPNDFSLIDVAYTFKWERVSYYYFYTKDNGMS